MEFLPCETHDYDGQCCQTVKRPLSKAEVVNERVYVCWDSVENSQNTLKHKTIRETKQWEIEKEKEI